MGSFFGIAVIVFDFFAIYPKETNNPFPPSLLFYPAIGFGVESLFHLLPLADVLIAARKIFTGIDPERRVWIAIVLVAPLEPNFQALLGNAGAPRPAWVVPYEWLHIFLFNLTQLILFKRYDFLSMYLMRRTYYGFWHVAWGYFRLEILF